MGSETCPVRAAKSKYLLESNEIHARLDALRPLTRTLTILLGLLSSTFYITCILTPSMNIYNTSHGVCKSFTTFCLLSNGNIHAESLEATKP